MSFLLLQYEMNGLHSSNCTGTMNFFLWPNNTPDVRDDIGSLLAVQSLTVVNVRDTDLRPKATNNLLILVSTT